MKRLLCASTICFGALFFGSATSGHAGTIISFSTTTSSGDLTTNASGTVLGIGYPVPDSQEYFTRLVISGAPMGNSTYNNVYLDEVYNGTTDTLTVAGRVPGLSGLTSPTSNLLTIVFASAGLTANIVGSSVSLKFPTDVVSITLSSAFATDLGLLTTVFQPNDLVSLQDNGNLAGQADNFNITNANLVLSTTVPEPGSMMTMMIGLAMVIFAARPKFLRNLARERFQLKHTV